MHIRLSVLFNINKKSSNSSNAAATSNNQMRPHAWKLNVRASDGFKEALEEILHSHPSMKRKEEHPRTVQYSEFDNEQKVT